MIAPTHLLEHVIRPVLKHLDLASPARERLLLGTACKESECGLWLAQLDGGPARGIYQMEPATEVDIWQNFLKYRDDLVELIRVYTGFDHGASDLAGNLYYATAMCGVHYLRVPAPIPEDLDGQARYWKKFYNTEKGKGTVDEYIAAWRRFVPAGVV